MHFWKFFIFM